VFKTIRKKVNTEFGLYQGIRVWKFNLKQGVQNRFFYSFLLTQFEHEQAGKLIGNYSLQGGK